MSPEQDYNQPVAYDAQGRPLYAHPPADLKTHPAHSSHVTEAPEPQAGTAFDPRTRVQYSNEPRVAHVTRSYDTTPLPISADLQKKHEASKRAYPSLNLSESEYVILAVRRHPIGLLIPVGGTVLALILIFTLILIYGSTLAADPALAARMPAVGDIALIAILMALLVTIFGYFATWIYLQNRFFMTNESVIQEKQHSLFAKHEQTVSLGSIEDASYRQRNFIESLFNYGMIRLSTEGTETTYRFYYASEPKKQVAIINNAIESFKNGRPVDDDMN